MTEDVKEVCAKFPLAAVALFGTGFVLAAVAFIVTELVSEWQGSGEGGAGRGGCDGSSTCHVFVRSKGGRGGGICRPRVTRSFDRSFDSFARSRLMRRFFSLWCISITQRNALALLCRQTLAVVREASIPVSSEKAAAYDCCGVRVDQ